MTPETAAQLDRIERHLRDWPHRAVDADDVRWLLEVAKRAEGKVADLESAVRAHEQMPAAALEHGAKYDAAWAERALDLLLAPGSQVYSATLVQGHVVVVDGRTGRDACERTAVDAINELLDEIDGRGSPDRLALIVQSDGSPALVPERGAPSAS